MVPSDTHKNNLKEEILQEITRISCRRYMVNQNVQDALRKLQDTKNKEHKKIQKKLMNSEAS
jgi:predicted nucleotide-binding protein (sugar kinase/HSP70/actin superfamily)